MLELIIIGGLGLVIFGPAHRGYLCSAEAPSLRRILAGPGADALRGAFSISSVDP